MDFDSVDKICKSLYTGRGTRGDIVHNYAADKAVPKRRRQGLQLRRHEDEAWNK